METIKIADTNLEDFTPKQWTRLEKSFRAGINLFWLKRRTLKQVHDGPGRRNQPRIMRRK